MVDLTGKYLAIENELNPNFNFIKNEINNFRILLLQGGTRSGKTYSVLQFIVNLCNKKYVRPLKVGIFRETLVRAKLTVREDLLNILKSVNLYNEKNHNKTENYYNLNGNLIYYMGADDEETIKGFDSDLIYLNEMPQIKKSVYDQLAMRCRGRIIGDYNPSYPNNYVYDLLQEETTAILKTTYRNNPFLTAHQIAEIEKHKDKNPEYYKIYGLGERGQIKGGIFSNWTAINEMPNDYPFSYAIDFGFSNDPATILQIAKHNLNLFINELCYEKGMTNLDLALMLYVKGINSNDVIYADAAEPKSIKELREGFEVSEDKIYSFCNRFNINSTHIDINECKNTIRNGFSVYLSRKGADSVRIGINKIKDHDVYVTNRSINIWNEYQNYTWQLDHNELPTNKPIDSYNHAIDAIRYYLLTNE